MTYEIPRHKVFPSFHHEDQAYKNRFGRMMRNDFVDKSVEDGDIDDNLSTETIRQKIRDEFIRDATVTIVLIGPGTWQRKHVDWEIGSSLRKTKRNSRCGLLGILLPNHPDYNKDIHTPGLIPPRLQDNLAGPNSYASIHRWTNNPKKIREWIHSAYQRKDKILPNNKRQQYKTTDVVITPEAGQNGMTHAGRGNGTSEQHDPPQASNQIRILLSREIQKYHSITEKHNATDHYIRCQFYPEYIGR